MNQTEQKDVKKYKCENCSRLLFEAEKVKNMVIHCRKCKHVNTFNN